MLVCVVRLLATVLITLPLTSGLVVAGSNEGLSQQALDELTAVGVNKYLGQFTPVSSEKGADGWVQHRFDAAGGEGPVCIDGSEYSVYTRRGRDKRKLLIMLQGGGACWQGLYRCNETAAEQAPSAEAVDEAGGIWDFDNPDNPFRHYSIVYMPYCDGSVFAGDNRVVDPDFDADTGVDGERHHRGLRNLSAGMDVAHGFVKKPRKITIAGSSAGGVGATAFAPGLARFLWGNRVRKLTVFNDAGPIAVSLDPQDAMLARQRDWQFDQYYPASCTTCSAFGHQTEIIKWRLANDTTIREAFYETDADKTNIEFASVNLPGFFDPLPPIIPFPTGLSQLDYRELVINTHQAVHDAYPDRYRRFIVSGDSSHTALQSDLFYTQQINGVFLSRWTRDFLNQKKSWWDLVQEFIPLE